ncbi:hypothetical protein H4582DRAFT_1987283 [Lactarius indigo]|nr:hypothetical protein H4582DRAFT_1987283 [Lactarius indigo]
MAPSNRATCYANDRRTGQNLNNPRKESAICKQPATPVNEQRRLTEQTQNNAMTQNLKNPMLNESNKLAQPCAKPMRERIIERHSTEPAETPPRDHDRRVDGYQRIEHNSHKEEQRTDTQKSMNASAITKNHLPYADPEPRPSASRMEARYGIPGPNGKTDHGTEEVIRLPNETRLPKENEPSRKDTTRHA